MRRRPSLSPTRRITLSHHVRKTVPRLRAVIATATQITYRGAADPQRVPLRINGDPQDYVAWVVPSRLDAVGPARTVVASAIAELCPWAPVDHIRIVVSEIVTNALCYGAPPCVLYLRHAPRQLLVAVYDGSVGFLMLRPIAHRVRRGRAPSTSRDGGRGLHLINELTHSWQVVPMAGGTAVIVHWHA